MKLLAGARYLTHCYFHVRTFGHCISSAVRQRWVRVYACACVTLCVAEGGGRATTTLGVRASLGPGYNGVAYIPDERERADSRGVDGHRQAIGRMGQAQNADGAVGPSHICARSCHCRLANPRSPAWILAAVHDVGVESPTKTPRGNTDVGTAQTHHAYTNASAS